MVILKVGFISLPLFHGPLDLTLGVLLGCGLSLVIQFFALAQANIDLHTAALEIYGKGNQGIAVLLHLAEEPHDLPFMHQQSPGTPGIGIEAVAVIVRGDVHLVQKHLAVLDAAPGVFQIQCTCADGFDLRTAELDTGFHFLFHEIFVIGFPVSGHDFDALLFQIPHLPESILIIA